MNDPLRKNYVKLCVYVFQKNRTRKSCVNQSNCMMTNKLRIALIALAFIWANILLAHPSPNTLVFLDIKADGVAAELRLPVSELGVALSPAAPKKAEELLGNFADSLKIYLRNHITPLSMDGQKWTVEVGEMRLEDATNPQERNALQDIVVRLWLKPPSGASSRQFMLNTLSDLQLDATAMTLSILGFNIGIELQQLLVVALVVPSLILLSKQANIYTVVRIGAATLSAIAAMAWIVQRISGKSNVFTEGVAQVFAYSGWLILGLAILAVVSYFFSKIGNFD